MPVRIEGNLWEYTEENDTIKKLVFLIISIGSTILAFFLNPLSGIMSAAVWTGIGIYMFLIVELYKKKLPDYARFKYDPNGDSLDYDVQTIGNGSVKLSEIKKLVVRPIAEWRSTRFILLLRDGRDLFDFKILMRGKDVEAFVSFLRGSVKSKGYTLNVVTNNEVMFGGLRRDITFKKS